MEKKRAFGSYYVFLFAKNDILCLSDWLCVFLSFNNNPILKYKKGLNSKYL